MPRFPLADPRPWLATLCVALLVSCSGAHLYRKQEHEQAKAALESFEEADLASTTEGERERMQTMLAREIALVRRSVLSQRDLTLRVLMRRKAGNESTWSYLTNKLEGRIKALAGSVAEARAVMGAARRMGRSAEQMRFNKLAGDTGSYRFHKRAHDQAAGELDAMSGGELKRIAGRLKKLRDARETMEEEVNAARVAYRATLEEQKGLVASGAAADLKAAAEEVKSKLDAIGTAGADLRSALGTLGIEDLSLLGVLAKAEETGALVDSVISSLSPSDDESDEADANQALPAFVLGAVASFVREIDDADDLPRKNELQLVAEHQRLQVEMFKRRIARVDGRLRLLGEKRGALLSELEHLNRSLLALTELARYCDGQEEERDASGQVVTPAREALPMAEIATDLAETFKDHERARELTLEALIEYSNAWELGRAEQEVIALRLIAARHDAALDDSEVAILQWENLIATPLRHLIAYYGSGIEPGTLVRLLQAAGVGAIAVGVN